MVKQLSIPLAAFLLLAGCSQAPPAPPDTRPKDIEAIRAAEKQSNSDWASRDIDRIARFWADDATLLMPGAPAIKGNAAIKAAVKDMVADPNFALTFSATNVQVSKAGDYGYTEGTSTMKMTDKKTKKVVTETGKYLTVFHKQADGSWKAVEDMYNADAAPVPAKAAAAATKAPAGKSAKAVSPAARKRGAKKKKR